MILVRVFVAIRSSVLLGYAARHPPNLPPFPSGLGTAHGGINGCLVRITFDSLCMVGLEINCTWTEYLSWSSSRERWCPYEKIGPEMLVGKSELQS